MIKRFIDTYIKNLIKDESDLIYKKIDNENMNLYEKINNQCLFIKNKIEDSIFLEIVKLREEMICLIEKNNRYILETIISNETEKTIKEQKKRVPTKKDRILSLLKNNNKGSISLKEISVEIGDENKSEKQFTFQCVSKLMKEGIIIRVSNGHYRFKERK